GQELQNFVREFRSYHGAGAPYRDAFKQRKGDQFLASWQTPVKEIVKSLVVICPALCCKMRRLPDKKSRVFVVLLEFDYREVVFRDKRGKLSVKLVASRARNTRVIVKLAA